MGYDKLINLHIKEETHEIFVFTKFDTCCYQDCNEYGTKAVGCLKMCPEHAKEAND